MIGGLAVQAAHRGGGKVTDGLNGIDGEQQADSNAGRRLKGDAEGQHFRQGKPGSLPHLIKAHHTEKRRQDIADDHTQQNGGQLADAFALLVQHHDRDQGYHSHQPVLPGTVDHGLGQTRRRDGLRRVAGASGHIVDGRGVEGQTDGKDHCTGDDRREQDADFVHHQANDQGHDAAHHHGAGNGRHTAAADSNGLHTGNIGEADAQNHRQTGAQPQRLGAQGKQLQQR